MALGWFAAFDEFAIEMFVPTNCTPGLAVFNSSDEGLQGVPPNVGDIATARALQKTFAMPFTVMAPQSAFGSRPCYKDYNSRHMPQPSNA
jgi:hypothetical protein